MPKPSPESLPEIAGTGPIVALDGAGVPPLPPDLLGRLRKKKGGKRPREQVCPANLQRRLTLKPVRRRIDGDSETITVSLDDYVLLSPEGVDPSDETCGKLQRATTAGPLALIECWAVDPDYDGRVFRSVWRDRRGSTSRDDDLPWVVPRAVLDLPRKAGERRVCVRARDVYGFETEAVQIVPEARNERAGAVRALVPASRP